MRPFAFGPTATSRLANAGLAFASFAALALVTPAFGSPLDLVGSLAVVDTRDVVVALAAMATLVVLMVEVAIGMASRRTKLQRAKRRPRDFDVR